MTGPGRSIEGRGLLAVFAHPDDESLAAGGLLAWCSAAGARVSLVCVTRGTGGRSDGGHTGAALGPTRERELRLAADTLGVHDLVVLDYEDGMLPWADASQLETEISDAIRARRPEVVITFDADGLYWHPDHIAVHERTTAAVKGLGRAPEPQPALYYVSMPPGAMRAVVDRAASVDRAAAVAPASSPVARHILGVADADAFGAGAPPATLVLDVTAYAAQKLGALRCHQTQMVDGALALITDRDARTLLGREHYRRAGRCGPSTPFIERLVDRERLRRDTGSSVRSG